MIKFFGILTFISLLLTVVNGLGVAKGKVKLVIHKIFAFITLTLAIIHIILVILGYY